MDHLDHEGLYRIVQARDARFDGRLFVGVKTTGVYCRPICPARTPAVGNVVFFPSAAAAHEAGFRPCLRCRPEVAPQVAAWHGSGSTVTRALRLIESEADATNVGTLAARLGMGERHLRRLFARHVGASPGAVARTRRVHLARQLVHETDLPLAAVAHAAGFGSVRRFNEVFKDLFGRPPAALRRHSRAAPAGDLRRGFTLRLSYTPPLAWDELLTFLARHAVPAVEAVIGSAYVRSIAAGGAPGIIAVAPGRPRELTLRVHCRRTDQLTAIVHRVRGLFDMAADVRAIDAHLSADPLLAPLVAERPGLRIAGAWNGVELAVRAMLGRQITGSAARSLAARLVATTGPRLDEELGQLYPGVTRLFPDVTDIAADLERPVGMPAARARAIATLARALDRDASLLEGYPTLDRAIAALTALPGIGDWTAQYIAMRELREPDAFPARDVALLRAAGRLTGTRMTPAALLRLAERWRPWRAYAAAHLWASLRQRASTSSEARVA